MESMMKKGKSMCGSMMNDMNEMDTMMQQCKKMCNTMSVEKKRECVSKMMPKCLDSILNALDDKESQKFAKDMKNKFNGVLDKYMAKD